MTPKKILTDLAYALLFVALLALFTYVAVGNFAPLDTGASTPAHR